MTTDPKNIHATLCVCCGLEFSETRPRSMGPNVNVCVACNTGVDLADTDYQPPENVFPAGRWTPISPL